MTIQSSIRLPWGKFSQGKTHHLAHHCADVAACFEAIVEIPSIRNRLEKAAGRELSSVDISRLSILTFLHDIGKIHPGFQAKCGLLDYACKQRCGHVKEGIALFINNSSLAERLFVNELDKWKSYKLLFASFFHHGRPVKLEGNVKSFWERVNEVKYDSEKAAKEIGSLLPMWFPEAFENSENVLPSDKPQFQFAFCGLVSLADWIGSTNPPFVFVPELDENYIEKAREKARQIVRDIGLDVGKWRENTSDISNFSKITSGFSPRSTQTLIGEWPLEDRLLILEDETGSGKTEAALWWYARLFEAGLVDSIYFALPTRVAAKQIHKRVNNALKNIFGSSAPEAILAVPGYLKAGEAEGICLPNFEVLWDDEGDEKKILSRWAAENNKRYLAAPVAVGTVDQAMLAALKVKHAHLRGISLSRSLLVIDEVHASDRYMNTIQQRLIKNHLELGGYAMLMSATLGSDARIKWLYNKSKRVYFDQAVKDPYPVVWGNNGNFSEEIRKKTIEKITGHEKKKEVEIKLIESWEVKGTAKQAIEAAKNGAKVLIIRNTVKAAIATFIAIKNENENLLWQVAGAPSLHHARFALEDRAFLDYELEKILSPKKEERSEGGVIVVGTQTLEQSLDIDADFLITDLCPVDVLLQRIGRLHRHILPRPKGFEKPKCIVLSPEGGLDRFTAPTFENGLGMSKDLRGVYTNLHSCELTRRLICEHHEWKIPEMNRFLVESATHEEKINHLNKQLGKKWENYWDNLYGKVIAEAQSARTYLLKTDEPLMGYDNTYPRLFPEDDELIRTRISPSGGQVIFTEKVVSPFGQMISSITLPSYWNIYAEFGKEIEPMLTKEGNLSFFLGETELQYSRLGLEKK